VCRDDVPSPSEIALDPELALLHALRVTLHSTVAMLQATLPDLPAELDSDASLDTHRIAAGITTRADDLARWIDLYRRARRSERAW
jgi:hypothetical protein